MNNPILTHRHLGSDYPVSKVGHADLVDAPDGSWYMVMLASRPQRKVCPLGRETFLARVSWEDGWPVVNPGIGKLEDEVELPFEACPVPCENGEFTFDGDALSTEFMSLRLPIGGRADLSAAPGRLRLYASAPTISEADSPSYLCVRPRTLDYTCTALISTGKAAAEYGIAVLQNETHHIRLVCREGKAEAVICCGGTETVAGSASMPEGECSFAITVKNLYADFAISGQVIADGINVDFLSTEIADGFVGNTAGLYCLSADSFDRCGKDAAYLDCSLLKLSEA